MPNCQALTGRLSLPLPRGCQLVTLKDAGTYITKLPKAEHTAPEWQAAMEALILVAMTKRSMSLHRQATVSRNRSKPTAKSRREAGAHSEVNMRLRDEVIASYLDDEWRTPPAVHRLLGDRGTVADIVSALERLARAGKIEAKHEAMMVPKFRDKSGPPVLCIDFYRKLQRRTPQHGDEGTGSRRRRTAGPTMFARIGMTRALNRHKPQEF